MNSDDLKERTKRFALEVIQFTSSLPRTREANVIARQLIRSGTSVGANYRAACPARSRADFISKIGVVEEEADETLYWLELLVGAEMVPKEKLKDLMEEAGELVAIFTATGRTAKSKRQETRQSALHNSRSAIKRVNPQSKIQNLP